MFGKLFKKKKKDEEEKKLEDVSTDDSVAQDDSQNNSDDDVRKVVDPTEKKSAGSDVSDMISQVDTSKLSFKEKAALKLFQKMPKKKQEKIMQQAMSPENVQKNKQEMLKKIDEMVASGQIDKSQVEAVKSRMGLR